MSSITIIPCTSLKGNFSLPGDKSISHRALLFSAMANGECIVTGLSNAEDVENTKKCLKQLGVKFQKRGNKTTVHGVGVTGFQNPVKPLYAGNSGTTIRLMSGLLAAQDFTAKIDGDESLRTRPMRRIIEPLELMGAQVDSESHKAPLKVYGSKLHAIDYASPIASAQVKSCILVAGLAAKGLTRVTEPMQSRDHTERMLEVFGVKVHSSVGMAAVLGPGDLQATDIDVPADISAAAFFLAGACLLPGSEIEIENVGINTTRTGVLDAFISMGALINKTEKSELNNEPRATLSTSCNGLHSTQLGGSMIPRIIDEVPIIAIAASQAHGITVIRDAGELRFKESDRIETITSNLRNMGAKIRDTKDGMVIEGPVKLKGAEIDSKGDHRIAMAFSIAGLIAEGETIINDIDCVNTSFPGFFEKLERLRCD